MKFTLGMIIQHKLGIPQRYAKEGPQDAYVASVLEGVSEGYSVQEMVKVFDLSNRLGDSEVAFDFETMPIEPGMTSPRLSCRVLPW